MTSSGNIALLLCFALSGLLPSPARAAPPGWEAVGLRAGADLTDGHNGRAGAFQLYQGYANYRLWRREYAQRLALSVRLDGAAGVLRRDGKAGALGSLGPTVSLATLRDRLSLEGGVSPAGISIHDYRARDLGGPFQFLLHAGIALLPCRHLELRYQFQHLSNAEIYRQNPGLNLHVVDLGFRF